MVIEDREIAKTLRHCQRVIRMVSELHKRGFQGLRIYPYQGSLGAWRLEIYPYNDFKPDNTLSLLIDRNSGLSPARHSGASDDYFDLHGSSKFNARQLASSFEKAFPLLCNHCKGRDWKYAGWLQELMGLLEADNRLPCVLWDDCSEDLPGYNGQSPLFLPIKKFNQDGYFLYERKFLLPPNPEFHSLN